MFMKIIFSCTVCPMHGAENPKNMASMVNYGKRNTEVSGQNNGFIDRGDTEQQTEGEYNADVTVPSFLACSIGCLSFAGEPRERWSI